MGGGTTTMTDPRGRQDWEVKMAEKEGGPWGFFKGEPLVGWWGEPKRKIVISFS